MQKSNQSFIFNIMAIVSLMVGIFCLFINKSTYTLIGLVPIFYALFFLSSIGASRFFSFNPGCMMIFIVSFLRYFLYPLLTALFGNYAASYSRNYYSEYSSLAVIMYIYEMLAIVCAISIYKRNHVYDEEIYNVDSSDDYICAKNNIIVFFLLALAVLCILADRSVLSNFNFVFSSNDLMKISYNESTNKITYLIVNIAKGALNLFLLIWAFKYYENHRTKFSYVFVIVMAFFSILFVSGTNRGSVIVPSVVSVFVLLRLFPERKKRILFVCGSLVLVAIVILTIRKSLINVALSGSSFGSWLGSYINSYYAGIDSFETALAVKSQSGSFLSISTLFKDIIYYIPGLGTKIINSSELSSRIFNHVLYGGITRNDAVIPTIGQGMIYFGYFFSVLPTMFFVTMALKFDDKIKTENKLWKIYLLTMVAVYFGNNYANNVNIIAQQIFQGIIPIYICYWLGDRIVFGNYGKE